MTKTWSRKRRPPAERFWEKVDRFGPPPASRPDPGNCWLWTASLNAGGYGQFGTGNGKQVTPAYHWSWESENGPRTPGLQLDHLCRVRRCVRPTHLEPVTQRENLMRGETLPALNSKKSHCLRLHEYSGANVYRDPKTGHRHCRECMKLNQRIEPEKPRVIYVSDALKEAIRKRYSAGGATYAQIADQHGIHWQTVGRVIRGYR